MAEQRVGNKIQKWDEISGTATETVDVSKGDAVIKLVDNTKRFVLSNPSGYVSINKVISSVHIQISDETTAREIHKLTKKIQNEIYSDY